MDVTDYTVVCAADERHLEQLRIVLPTWQENCPDLLDHPAILMVDARNRGCLWWIRNNPAPDWFDLVPNPYRQHICDSQRDYMLSGFLQVMATVRTPWALKIDTDVFCVERRPNWVPLEHLRSGAAIVAPRWGYTTPAEYIDLLNAWGKRIPQFAGTPGVGGMREQARGKERIRHSRICSWFGFFSRTLCEQTMKLIGDGPFPCPSQDTTHWYVANRLEMPVVRWKPLGWRVCSSTRALRRFSTEILHNAPT